MKIFYDFLRFLCSGNSYFVTGCLSIQSLDSPPFSSALVWLMENHALPLVTKCFSPNPFSPAPVWLTGRHDMPLVTKWFSPKPLPREAEDFPRGGDQSKACAFTHIPSLIATNLLWSWICIYTCQTADIFASGENFDKKHRAAATLINSHESRN